MQSTLIISLLLVIVTNTEVVKTIAKFLEVWYNHLDGGFYYYSWNIWL